MPLNKGTKQNSEPSRMELSNTPIVPLQGGGGGKGPSTNECPIYDNKYLMVRLQKWNFGECGVPLHYYYFQVHPDQEW